MFQKPIFRELRRHSTTVHRAALIAMLALLVLPGIAMAKATLWLYPESDSPRSGGHKVEGDSLTLNVENRGRGNGDNTAYEVYLLVSVNDESLFTQLTLGLDDGTEIVVGGGDLTDGTPVYSCSGRSIPRHGVFPALHGTVLLGDIEQDEVVTMSVTVEGANGLEVHFDAFGTGFKTNPQGTRCEDVFNAMGHDVTLIFGSEDAEEECAEIDVSKVADPSAIVVGDEVAYTITVENSGDEGCDFTDVVVLEDIPTVNDGDGGETPAFSIVGMDPTASSESDTEIVWQVGTLAGGDSQSFELTVLFDEELADATRVENTVCVEAAELDEEICATAVVVVGDAPRFDYAQGPGFWCNQVRFALTNHQGSKLPLEDLQAWLDEIKVESDVFDEVFGLDDLEAARAVLCAGGPTSAEEKLARHLLTLWFNVVSGFVDSDISLEELCLLGARIPEDLDLGQTIGGILLAAESELVSETADESMFLYWKDVIDAINNSIPIDSEMSCEDLESQIQRLQLRSRTRGRF
jgi:uncharacterized repeat protein (TIGR01451 family)